MTNIVVKLVKIVSDQIVSAKQYQKDLLTKHVGLTSYISPEEITCNFLSYQLEKLNMKTLFPEEIQIESVKIEKININDPIAVKIVEARAKLNFPTMTKCQNCETNFPTKYQFQRHQCEFNAEKVVLKQTPDAGDAENPVRAKYDCSTCGKQFVSKNNLDRHQAGHENIKDNVCEHCGKHFVSENRLRIHKENHCKKAGDISKFYRSDVTVWKCKKCHEVFSSMEIGNYHVTYCTDATDFESEPPEKEAKIANNQNKKPSFSTEHKHVEKILTEILLQCEFCNRTYADKNLLLMHQRKHTTEKNYQCVNCNEVFDSYATAVPHWMKKCSEFANLFYLPKLTYCEYCDRTFKSHEILYNHKIKKKHYTPKLHIIVNVDQCRPKQEKDAPTDNKEVINQLIADVLKTLDVPVEKNTVEQVSTENKENFDPSVVKVKSEPESEENSNALSTPVEPEKKKRGRKRKHHKPFVRSKKFSGLTDEGFKLQCERCIKVFNTIGDLENHREKEHAASFSCDECGQVLHSAKALLIHSRAHRSLKPYVCDTCGRSYSQTSHLWQHMRFHQGIKPFACPHEGCEARYTIRPDLKDHIRKVHTRERPFKCNVCNKCFLTGSVYYQHRLIHTNDRRYGCDVCQKRFFRADALNNHKRIHTDERPYPCGVCGREFRQKGDRNKHLRTQHPDSNFLSNGS